jgi:dTDP-4-amino-4,6-dideoxygalactose transaminase
MYTIRLPEKTIRDNLKVHLENKRIFSKIYFNPIHMTTYYKQYYDNSQNSLPVTETISDQILTLPLYLNMTNEEKLYLTESILEFFES